LRDSIVPIALIAAGAVWLLFNLDWIPSFNWVVTLILIGSGAGILVIEGTNKKSIVGGSLLIALGIAWFLHFHYYVQWRFLAPAVCIVAGILMLVARTSAIPDTRARPDAGDQDKPD
jgi:hypothetical protein